MTDISAIYREDATADETIEAYQSLIDTGQAWQLEGSVGRTAMDLIETGYCMLGPDWHIDYWGNRVPSRDEVEPGTPGSPEYVNQREQQ